MVTAIIRTVCVALDQLNDVNYETTHDSADSFNNESVHRNHVGTIVHCDNTIASGRLVNSCLHFEIIGGGDGMKCGF